MKGLKRVLDRGSLTPVTTLLEAHVGGYEPARSKKIIHASDLTKEDPEYCPREHHLMQQERIKQAQPYIDTLLRITFDDGVEKQSRVNNVYLKNYMVGYWRCKVCKGLSKWRKGPPPVDAGECACIANPASWVYEEPVFVHPTNKTSGSVDALIDIGKKKLWACELKIMATSMFPPKLALSEHTLRSRLYLKLIAESNHPHRKVINTKKMSVLYMCRGHGKKDPDRGELTPFKEFIIERDDTEIEEIFNKAMALTLVRKNKKMIPYGVCASSFDNRAKQCKASKACFSGKYPPKVTWEVDGAPEHPPAKHCIRKGKVGAA